MAFRDVDQNYNVTVMKYAGGGWQTVGTAGFGGPAASVSLQVRNGVPWVAFGYEVGGGVSVMKYE